MKRQSQEHLGTLFTISLPDASDDALFSLCFAELARIDNTFSRFLDDNELARLNNCVGKWCTVSDELYYLLQCAKQYTDACGGSFSCHLKRRLEQLGYGADSGGDGGSDGFLLGDNNAVLLHAPVEFGGFGKGYALERVRALLDERSVSSYVLNGGGDIYVRGRHDVVLEHPLDSSLALGTVTLCDEAVCGSSSNRRRFGTAHHLLHPATGEPVNDVLGVFIRCASAMDADAYATACFCAGLDGIALSKKLGVPLLLVTADKRMYVADDFGATLYS